MKKIVTMLFVLIVLLSLYVTALSASAANVCYEIRGDLTKTVTFKVDVGKILFSSEKIVLTQTQGSTRQTFYGKEKNIGMYGRFYVSVYDNTAKKWVYSNQYWKSKTFTIKSSKLKKKHSYTITVEGDMERYVLDSYSKAPYVFREWRSYPTWSASKTGKNVKFCGY